MDDGISFQQVVVGLARPEMDGEEGVTLLYGGVGGNKLVLAQSVVGEGEDIILVVTLVAHDADGICGVEDGVELLQDSAGATSVVGGDGEWRDEEFAGCLVTCLASGREEGGVVGARVER